MQEKLSNEERFELWVQEVYRMSDKEILFVFRRLSTFCGEAEFRAKFKEAEDLRERLNVIHDELERRLLENRKLPYGLA